MIRKSIDRSLVPRVADIAEADEYSSSGNIVTLETNLNETSMRAVPSERRL
jgi:hypothetical protein